jgi:hypothetical protein
MRRYGFYTASGIDIEPRRSGDFSTTGGVTGFFF